MKRLLLLPVLLLALVGCDDPEGAYRFNRTFGMWMGAWFFLFFAVVSVVLVAALVRGRSGPTT